MVARLRDQVVNLERRIVSVPWWVRWAWERK